MSGRVVAILIIFGGVFHGVGKAEIQPVTFSTLESCERVNDVLKAAHVPAFCMLAEVPDTAK